MSKKHNSNLGRSLIKDRFSSNKGKKFVADKSMLHTTEIQDGYDWGRLNLQSVTEESSFQEFLSTAELAGTEFQAEKLNIKFVNPRSNVGLLTKDEIEKTKKSHDRYRDMLKIPRRPLWSSTTSPSELEQNERDHFLEWRRNLAQLQEDHGCMMTPYEKNLEFWRQLWRVIERSDVLVQIVDSRNPLLFRCEDLEKYVIEVSADKMNLILVNKADFLTSEQRQSWADYFTSIGMRIAFFSATQIEEEEPSTEEKTLEKIDIETLKQSINELENAVENTSKQLYDIDEILQENDDEDVIVNTNTLLSRNALIDLFRKLHKGPKVTKGQQTIGLVGYPNVGKSSTINALLSEKKVSVSATPGKTKHFQTLFLDENLVLCDCPGLVMPSFVFTKAEMITNGILPVDQMRDHVPPTNLVSSLIPRYVIEDKYGIMLPLPMEGEDPNRCPTAEELLNAYGYNRGFMTANGQPDNPRSARYVLKDYICGKLLYCTAPPNVNQAEYHTWPERQKTVQANRVVPPRQARAVKPNRVTTEDLDKLFFRANIQGVHSKGNIGKPAGIPIPHNKGEGLDNTVEKPWKKINKHVNKNKKEKLRRVYAHLDQH